MRPIEPLADDDFSDLELIIAETEQRRASARTADAKRKRLAKGGLSEEDQRMILAEIRRYEEAHVWRTDAAVAFFHSQTCLSCGHRHRFFMGWMTSQQHKNDPNCRRLIRGKPVEPTPCRIEDHAQPPVEMCDDCAEANIELQQIIDSVYPPA